MLESKKCPTCGLEMRFAGENSFRIGGTSGDWKLLFGEWAELGENMIPLVLYICRKCGKVEFYANEKIRKSLVENQSQNVPESEFGRVLREEKKKKE